MSLRDSRVRPVSVLEKARRDRGFTQAELARRAGISPQYVGLIEAGLRPSLRVKGAIAAVLGIEPAELWPEHDSAPAGNGGAVQDRREDRRHGQF
jgi:transcriptional regulator with XRE-family HTH domain